MKLKYKFVIREVGGAPVAVAVGADSADFSGMVKLNDTGAFLFGLMNEHHTEKELAAALCEKYDVSEKDALAAVLSLCGRLSSEGLLDE